MAVTIQIYKIDNAGWIVDVEETSTASGASVALIDSDANAREAASTKLPKMGRIMRVRSRLSSGSATTVAPQLAGISAGSGFLGKELIMEVDPANVVDEQPEDGVRYAMTGDTIYHRSNPNSGSDNIISTRYLIRNGWTG